MPLKVKVDRKEGIVCCNTKCKACDPRTLLCKLGMKCKDYKKESK